MSDRWWLVTLLLVMCGCVRSPAPPPISEISSAEPALAEVWVDAYAPGSGDGTKARPYKRVPELAGAVRLELVAGVYAGPFAWPAGTRVTGHGEVVLTREGPGVVVEGHDLRLTAVAVQGGTVGLRLDGRSGLERVHVSGFREAGIEVLAGASLDARGLTLEARVPDTVGLRAEGATLWLSEVRLAGGLRPGLKVEGGALRLEQVESVGPKSVVNVQDAKVTVRGLFAQGGSGPALFVARGRATVDSVEVVGHEFALQVASGARVEVRGLSSRGAQQAGVVVVGSQVDLVDVMVEGSGPGGGLSLLDANTTVRDTRVRKAASLGIFVRKGRARLSHVVVEGVTGEQASLGDAIHVRDAELVLEDVTTRDTEGNGLFASAFATVKGTRLVCERSGVGAVLVERGAQLELAQLEVHGTRGAAVTALQGARVDLSRLTIVGGADAPVWAECEGGTAVTVKQLDGAMSQPPSPCVVVGR